MLHFLNNNDFTYAVKHVEDAEPLIELNKDRRSSGIVGSSDMKHAAEFPAVVVENYCNTKGITFKQFMEDSSHAIAMLNDPDLRYFRIWEGRVTK